ncbi:unnamed protein product, partial [Polarella glacialis]
WYGYSPEDLQQQQLAAQQAAAVAAVAAAERSQGRTQPALAQPAQRQPPSLHRWPAQTPVQQRAQPHLSTPQQLSRELPRRDSTGVAPGAVQSQMINALSQGIRTFAAQGRSLVAPVASQASRTAAGPSACSPRLEERPPQSGSTIGLHRTQSPIGLNRPARVSSVASAQTARATHSGSPIGSYEAARFQTQQGQIRRGSLSGGMSSRLSPVAWDRMSSLSLAANA